MVDQTNGNQSRVKAAGKEIVQNSKTNWLFLSPPLSADDLDAYGILVEPDRNLKRILNQHFGQLSFAVVHDRIAVAQEGLPIESALKLVSTFASLSYIVQGGSVINTENVTQAITQALVAQNNAADGVVEFSREGKKVDRVDVDMPELRGSYIFDSVITRKSSVEDASYIPSEVLKFFPKASGLFSRLNGDNGYFFKAIAKLGSDIKIDVFAGKPSYVTIHGELKEIERVRKSLIQAAELISDRDYDKPHHFDLAVLCAAGKMSPGQLPEKGAIKKGGARPAIDALAGDFHFYEPDSKNQRRYVALLESGLPGVMAQGPAGTGKTRFFLQHAIKALADHYRGVPGATHSKLILSIPLVTVGGRDLGAMPGDMAKKTSMWFDTYYEQIIDILSPPGANGTRNEKQGEANLKALMAEGVIQIAPLEFLRGKSLRNALVALDEAENTTLSQMKTFLTRSETTSRAFVFGDLEQKDRPDSKLPQGDAFLLPPNIHVEKDGSVWLYKDSRRLDLGSHLDFGHFVRQADGGLALHPYNGFAAAWIILPPSPHVGCTTLDISDVRRSDLVHDVLALWSGLRCQTPVAGREILSGPGSAPADQILKDAHLRRPNSGAVVPFARKGAAPRQG
ncbi:MAG: PhoH family protein [Alphaproteobacteria bacterium]|nr:PhoH family protein [Alphaproteobacteria bacterium]